MKLYDDITLDRIEAQVNELFWYWDGKEDMEIVEKVLMSVREEIKKLREVEYED